MYIYIYICISYDSVDMCVYIFICTCIYIQICIWHDSMSMCMYHAGSAAVSSVGGEGAT